MKLLDEADGFIEGDIFVKYYMLNRLTFKVGLYNMFQWHFRGSRPMTRQYHDNWLRIYLELKGNHSPRCESDYNISLRPMGFEKVAISPLFSKSTHQTRRIQCWFNVEPPCSQLAHHQLQLQFTVSPICRICRTYSRQKEGVSIFGDCERELPLSARRSCPVIFD